MHARQKFIQRSLYYFILMQITYFWLSCKNWFFLPSKKKKRSKKILMLEQSKNIFGICIKFWNEHSNREIFSNFGQGFIFGS